MNCILHAGTALLRQSSQAPPQRAVGVSSPTPHLSQNLRCESATLRGEPPSCAGCPSSFAAGAATTSCAAARGGASGSAAGACGACSSCSGGGPTAHQPSGAVWNRAAFRKPQCIPEPAALCPCRLPTCSVLQVARAVDKQVPADNRAAPPGARLLAVADEAAKRHGAGAAARSKVGDAGAGACVQQERQGPRRGGEARLSS